MRRERKKMNDESWTTRPANVAGIDYIAADNGGLTMYVNLKKWGRTIEPLWSNTVDGIVDVIDKYGVAPVTYGSSGMTFAIKEGFDTDDGAMHLWKKALERAGV